MASLEEDICQLLQQKELTLGTVESATGGLISHRITNVAGSSAYHQGAIVAYSNRIKINIAGVREVTIGKYGAVSAEVAEEMAAGGRKVLGVDICISDTGIAGPGGATADKPLGLFYLGLSHAGGTFSQRHTFTGSRTANKEAAAETALAWLKAYLLSLG
jgi:nicotinamide-nucleotide amidase